MQDEVEYGPARPWHIITQENVDDAVSTARYNTCQQCPQFNRITKQCSICHCFMPLKVKITIATCPENKW